MNRKIKFRGKSAENGSWIYGHLLYNSWGTFIINHYSIDNGRIDPVIQEKVIPETEGQLIDLTDKNSTEIYEGDIVKERYYPIGAPKGIEYYKLGVVVWDYNRYTIELKIDGVNILDPEDQQSHHKQGREMYNHPTLGYNYRENNPSFKKVEVIGNIHDNPELITVD